MSIIVHKCTICKNYINRQRCRAFEIIPDEIWRGDDDHREPYPGDNGIQFEPIEEEDEEDT